ncbi:hypothetical protein ASE92_06100 [Pedobacter sp. Leaf41]|jgi:hypothetical protein|uniref:hypothetical protein n=1 Tax=Pedobacter sp. Leaf41 TaxID=1736218 RepID=UPI000703B16E|nr:hypothetical protein [Pedobacter sp. Leaf41]KQN38984.1 hypothetical protein ASE92_06100 [Pedobacter sp. Leaf41]
MKNVFGKRFIFIVLAGLVLLAFFFVSLFDKGESGNSGMSLKLQKFIPFVAFLILEAFLIAQALYFFAKKRISNGMQNIYAAALLGVLLFLIFYIEHQFIAS